MKEIPLANGKGAAIVDDEWYPILSKWSWHLTCKGYVERSVRPGFGIMMHRVVNMTPMGLWTDHINGNKLDNRSANLRECSNSENSQSRRRKVPSSSGFRGVSVKPNGKFEAAITINYKKTYIGFFGSAEEAARAYDKKAIELHRSFAGLNFPENTRADE